MTHVNTAAAERRERILRAAVHQGLLAPDRADLAAFLDLDGVAASVTALHEAFPDPPGVLHTFAAKANCLVPVLRELRTLGMGCEVAGAGELAQALAAGFAPDRIVFDSPAKTRSELARALELGVAVNADNFQELDRIDEILALRPSASRIGVRVNPQVGGGDIAETSTATATSKFGIALDDEGSRRRLLDAYRARPWLTWVHAHVGSQGCPLELIAEGIARAVAFADEVGPTHGRRQVRGVDVGGGLPVNFGDDETVPGFDAYVRCVRSRVPRLFGGRYRLVTEFGRSLLAKNGFTAARVEYTKTSGGRPVAITHAGAQVAARTVFTPSSWPLRISAHGPDGSRRAGEPVPQDIAGPCCFAGDLLARARPLPLLAPGDIVCLLDTGAYYASTPFHYNSLPDPAVHGVRVDAHGGITFEPLRRAETLEDVLARTGG
ncbi:diaminopimelate decarboxylase [Streptomyces humidus]|uniref:Diaminopimelate decarboxylase n=1 Tax=Streptomyces humidus TaxID=52259 RepID=A0A918L4E1_9ACTN|nr:diaminopimelate decarboxylase [Streptomyces humidus]GGR95159.1 diaminopimelate decarboxylase [Streptomyces humidus]